MPALKEVRIALLFADLVGSTTLYEERGDGPAQALVSLCRQHMSEAVSASGGVVVKTLGDGIMARFDDGAPAFAAARAMMAALAALPSAPGLRVGVHYGPTLAENGDYFGDTVNVAARLMELAQGGEILTTLTTLLRLTEVERHAFLDMGFQQLKGRAEAINLYRLQESFAREAIAGAADPGVSQPVLRITGPKGLHLSLGMDQPVAAIGSGKDCEIRLALADLEPHHARVEWQGSDYVLVDSSSQGSYLCYPGQAPVFLRHEEAILRGHGQIFFGQPGCQEALVFELVEP